jgi:hypothetical protein
MSHLSSVSVRPFRKAALATLTPDHRKLLQENYKEMSAHERTTVDYRRIAKERPLTATEKQDLYLALEAQRKAGCRWVIQTGIDCGVYALKPLVRCRG